MMLGGMREVVLIFETIYIYIGVKQILDYWNEECNVFEAYCKRVHNVL